MSIKGDKATLLALTPIHARSVMHTIRNFNFILWAGEGTIASRPLYKACRPATRRPVRPLQTGEQGIVFAVVNR